MVNGGVGRSTTYTTERERQGTAVSWEPLCFAWLLSEPGLLLGTEMETTPYSYWPHG